LLWYESITGCSLAIDLFIKAFWADAFSMDDFLRTVFFLVVGFGEAGSAGTGFVWTPALVFAIEFINIRRVLSVSLIMT